MRRLLLPFGPIDPRLRASLLAKARHTCFWDYRTIEHNRIECMYLAREFQLEDLAANTQVREP